VGRDADRLGLRFFDREMLRIAAEYVRNHDAPAESQQTDSSWWSRISQAFAMAGPDSHCAPPSVESVYEGDLFEIEERLLREIVDDEATVVVGRGAAQTLRGRTGVLSVFLHAPEPWRIDRIQDVYRLADRRAAQQMVHDSDRARAQFIQSLGDVGWTDVRGYDLALIRRRSPSGGCEPDRGSGESWRGDNHRRNRFPRVEPGRTTLARGRPQRARRACTP
jgi:cytidylate kinase